MINYNGFNPYLLTCYKPPFEKIRIGKDYDGGYVICDIPNINYELILGCGVSDDISFEEQFCDKYKNAPCYLYDGSIDSINLINKNMIFIKKNINNFNDENNTNLHDIINKYSNIFLKMDIEGYEIQWIKSLNDEQLNKINQIVIEFHFPFEDYKKDVFNKLNKYFILVHFHGNNCCGIKNHNGINIPNVFECTYLHRKFFNNNYELNTDPIPGILDMKNIIVNDEIFINYEPFVNNISVFESNVIIKERNELITMFDDNVNKLFCNLKIPKKIIQTWENKNFEPEFQKIVDSWKDNNPEYDYILFDNHECYTFIKDNFDKNVLNTYESIIPGAFKADLFRYCYLYINGGVYVDIDTLCIGKLDNFLLANIEFVVPIDLNVYLAEGQHNLFNTFIASIPKHPALLECINKIIYNVKHNIVYPSKLDFTGPGLLGRCVNKYIGNNETESFVDKQGISNNIHFLNFEEGIEYVKDLNGNILFQNKNGNKQIIQLYNQECNKLKEYVCWVSCLKNKIINYDILMNHNKMIYYDFFDRRKNTFIKSHQLILDRLKNNNDKIYNIVELGSTRSFVNGGEEGCLSTNIKYWYPHEPHKWDWGAGIFTKVFSENLIINKNQNYKIYTIDPNNDANIISTTMCSNNPNVSVILNFSSNFLNNFADKIDFLYMDHMETSEEAALIHLQDIKLIIENNLMAPNGIILIDDIAYDIYGGKGKYSIPYLLENNYKILVNEYQVLLVKSYALEFDNNTDIQLDCNKFIFESNVIIKEPKLEIKKYIQNWHNDFSIPNDHINFLKKIAIDFEPHVIYDIGANVLHWTREAHKIWPNSEIIVFDAVQDVEFFYKEHNLKYNIGVLSDEDNKVVKFYGNTYNFGGNSYYKEIGSSKSNEIYPENLYTEYKTNKLSSVVEKNNFQLPDLIKIDVQGAELDIIKGSLTIINNAKFLIVELQHTQYNRGAPLADITIKFLEDNNWELIASKFCNNGPDADYCFKNKKYFCDKFVFENITIKDENNYDTNFIENPEQDLA